MAQEPIFSAPDPKTSNLFARYTQEQVPVLPSGYLESFATAAKLRADQANQANQLSLEREKMALASSEKGEDRRLDFAKTSNESKKLDNEAAKVKMKDDIDYKKYQLQLKTDKMKVFSDSLSIARTNYNTLNGQLIENDNKDEKEKMPKAERDALVQKVAAAQAGVNAIGARYLQHANDFETGLNGREETKGQTETAPASTPVTSRYAPPQNNGAVGSPAQAPTGAYFGGKLVDATMAPKGELITGRDMGIAASRYSNDKEIKAKQGLAEEAYARGLARFKAEGGTPGRASERLQVLIDEEQTKLMGQTPQQAAESTALSNKKSEDEAKAKITARIEAKAMNKARAIYDRIPVNQRASDDLNTIYQEQLAEEYKFQQVLPPSSTPVSIFDIPSIDDPVGGNKAPQFSTYSNSNPMSQPVGTQIGVDAQGNPTYGADAEGVSSELDGAVMNGKTTGLKNKAGQPLQSTILHNKDTGVFTMTYNPDVKSPEYVAHNRKLEFATWLLNSHPELLKNIKTDINDEAAANSMFGHEGNTFQLGTLSKAWKLVRDIEESETTGKYNQNADLASELFRVQFGAEPNEFWATGRSALSAGTDIDMGQGGEKTKMIREAQEKIAQAVATRPQAVDINSEPDDTAPKIAKLNKQIDVINQQMNAAVGDPETLKDLKTRQEGLIKQVNSVSELGTARKNDREQKVQLSKSFDTSIQAQLDLIKSIETVRTSETADSAAKKYAIELAGGFPGYDLDSLNEHQGYSSKGLKQDATRLIQVPQLNSQGKPVIGRDGKPLTTNKRLSVREVINLSIKNGKPDNILAYWSKRQTPEQSKAVKESLDSYKKGYPSIVALHKVAKELKNSPTGVSTLKKILGEENNAIAVYISTLKAAYRTFAVGGGNPSNYEQELLGDLVPDPNQILSIDGRNVRRYENLALMSVVINHQKMVDNGLELTPQALEMYNKQLSGVIGRKITKEELENLSTTFQNNSTNYDKLKKGNASEQNLKDARNLMLNAFDAITTKPPE